MTLHRYRTAATLATPCYKSTRLRRLFWTLLIIIGGTANAPAQDSASLWLDRLDASLAQRNVFEQARVDRINALKNQLKALSAEQGAATDDERRFELNYQLYDEYKSYCYDSARHYAYDCLNVSMEQGRSQQVARSQIAIAFCLISAGILSEAHDVLTSIQRQQLSGELLCDYYDQYSRLWRSMADYVKEEPFYTKYITQSNAYLDSLLMLWPEGSVNWYSYKGSHQMRDRQYNDALQSLNKVLELCGDDKHLRAVTCAEMAWAYMWMNDEENAMVYFAQSAIDDNETATREITALYHLSRLVYKRGDYERASNYVHQALEDVNFYNTRLRKVEINDILPIIEQDRYDVMRSQRNWLFLATGLAVALLIAVLGSYWFIRKKNHKLTEARQTIASQLEDLQVTNRQLKEADKIKNAYIGRSFYTNAEFVEKLEKLFLSLDRKIATRQYEDLRSTLKQSTLNTERENMYAAFDETFLKLFPDFVESTTSCSRRKTAASHPRRNR